MVTRWFVQEESRPRALQLFIRNFGTLHQCRAPTLKQDRLRKLYNRMALTLGQGRDVLNDDKNEDLERNPRELG